MNNPEFTIRLSDFVRSHLGDNLHRPLPQHLAELISALLKRNPDCLLCYIQFPSEQLEEKISSPHLWDYNAWKESSEKHFRDKEKSERERKERYVMTANVDKLSWAIVRRFNLDRDKAVSVAWRMMKRKDRCSNVIKEELGVEKLITTVEEI